MGANTQHLSPVAERWPGFSFLDRGRCHQHQYELRRMAGILTGWPLPKLGSTLRGSKPISAICGKAWARQRPSWR